LNTADKLPSVSGPFVTRDVCEAVHGEQREANARTWDEIRTLRRLVIGLVVGGQLFSGGLNVAGVAYWLAQHSAQPHPATVQMLATARAETREDLGELRREMRELIAAAAAKSQPPPGAPPAATAATAPPPATP
jgi:hypothetical protein